MKMTQLHSQDVTNSPKDWHDFWYNSTSFNESKVTCYIDNKQVNCDTLKEHYYETKY